MLTISTIDNATAAKSYYSSRGDYYIDDLEPSPTWNGKLRDRLNLPESLHPNQFIALCDNLHPHTGQPLTGAVRDDRDVGRDFTFSPPKSVTLAGLIGGDDRVIAAVNQAVAETMALIEAETMTRVRKGKANGERRTGEMLWAMFPHLTTRPIGGEVDPQYHIHAVAMNLTYDPVEKQYKAIQFKETKRNSPYYQAAFHAILAKKLEGFGYETRKTKDAFEIVSIPDRAIKEFSRRRALIEKVVEDYGFTNPESIAKLGAKTRERKAEGQPWGSLLAGWEKRLQPKEIEAIRVLPVARYKHKDRSVEAVKYALDHLLERDAVVSQRDVAKEALRYGVGAVSVDGVYAAIGKADLVRREINGQVMLSSREVLSEEQRLVKLAINGRGRCRPLRSVQAESDHFSAQRLSVNPSQKQPPKDSATLSPSQQAAIAHVWNSPDKIILVRGYAGTGKTTMTKTALAGIDVPYVILAPSSEASRGVLRSEGFENADTLARFLVDTDMQAGVKGGLIWLDEASLAGSKDVARLSQLANSLNARLVFSGDPRQHKSVSRGDVLALLEDNAGLPVAIVSEVQRQRGDYKKAVEAIAKGDVVTGFERLDKLGWVHLMPVWDKYAGAANEYIEAIKAGKSALLVSPSHKEGDLLTECVRQELGKAGLLTGESHTFSTLRPANWTEAERGDARNYQPGHVVRYIRNANKVKSGTKLDYTEGMKLSDPLAFQVYERQTIDLRAGDTIRLTANQETMDGHKGNNGATYRVAGFDKHGNIELDNGWKLAADSEMFTHGLVNTSYASQGKTVDKVIVVQGDQSLGATNMAQFYVSVTRGREQASVWVDSKINTLEAIQHEDTRLLASDLVRQPIHRIRTRLKRHVAFLRQIPSMLADRAFGMVRPTHKENLRGY